MHPEHHSGWRKARAEAISRQYSRDADAVFTDAAAYSSYPAFALAVSPAQGGQAITASVKTLSPAEAEEAAIPLAISSTQATTVVTDSQQACRHFQAGTVHAAVRAMLLRHPPQR
ncbi:hypothetical protein HPB48_015859 [Haemaphysalis longicornis]|uniref:Uncharacterized protein n=1 Tax=Haemaphysalis longicornis TaxID=44386 RepID=A0A9J6H1R3_HAELO|nr:hypothetical protein HPB48_015859 [Haemaphysalis longicornis]